MRGEEAKVDETETLKRLRNLVLKSMMLNGDYLELEIEVGRILSEFFPENEELKRFIWKVERNSELLMENLEKINRSIGDLTPEEIGKLFFPSVFMSRKRTYIA